MRKMQPTYKISSEISLIFISLQNSILYQWVVKTDAYVSLDSEKNFFTLELLRDITLEI